MKPALSPLAAARARQPANNHRPEKPYFPASSPSHGAPPWRDRSRPPERPYQFTIELRRSGSAPAPNLEALIAKSKPLPEKFFVFYSGVVAARLFFSQWVHARDAMVSLCELRLLGDLRFDPVLKSDVLQPSDKDELDEDLKTLFADHVRGLLTGAAMAECCGKLDRVVAEIADVNRFLSKSRKLGVFDLQMKKKKGLVSERELLGRRIQEFKTAMDCLLVYLEGKCSEESGEKFNQVFKFHGRFNWSRIHCLITRELRRLQDGLPIYSFRREILQQIRSQQITVLIGETGSGKSTQLAQYLSDSGVAAGGSIICTQPRKIAAITLARRVAEESSGCYGNNSVIFCPAYSADQEFDSQVMYMTDHCLLQLHMNEKNLAGISCIIVDEAHERSLNTDLLLALIKNLLLENPDLRLIVMSATADAKQLSNYFFGCETFHVVGRSFPVDVKYVPSATIDTSGSAKIASYVSDAVNLVAQIHRTEEEGTVLAFLTSQIEVEWACENFQPPDAASLPLHGKLSNEEQLRVFQNYPGKRKVIFSTNIAETSLTIPGVKYVVDSGLVKESRFESRSGMNILRVFWTSQSSAKQRSGRAGRTEPGKCYRMYSEEDYESMQSQQEPEICRVHLGVAVLKILALGLKKVQDFDFIDAPSSISIDMAIRNLVQLGAITLENKSLELTEEGRNLVKLGIEPRLGKIILGCFNNQLGREGLVLAALMANASSIFCRVGSFENKQKSDCLKLQFCHRNGDLFTLLSVYKEWDGVPRDKRNKWCWDNSINAKAMRRCQDTVKELEQCLKNELRVIIPSYWRWNPHLLTNHDKTLKNIVLSALPENIAMYTGYDRLGYEVALTGKTVDIHPSSSLLMFSEKPQWVVFGEIIVNSTQQYLVCVTAFDLESLSLICPAFDVSKIERRKLQVKIMSGFGSTILKKFCGKGNNSLLSLVSRVQKACMDERIGIEVKYIENTIGIYAPSECMEMAVNFVTDALMHEKKWLRNECLEKCLYHGGPGVSPPIALFGAGARIKHLELEKRYLSVDVYASSDDDKELIVFLEKYASGNICGIQKLTSSGHDNEEKQKLSRITFLTPDAAEKVIELDGYEFNGFNMKVTFHAFAVYNKMLSFPTVKAKILWPRRRSNGCAKVQCDPSDFSVMVDDLSALYNVRCEPSMKYANCVVVSGLDKDLSEIEILDMLRAATSRRIVDFHLWRGVAVENPPCRTCEEAILREVSPFMPQGGSISNFCRVQVFPPELKDSFVKGMITFDGRLHLEAAKALEQIEGKALPGCFSWQKIKCQRLFHSFVSCPAFVYDVIRNDLESLLARLRHRKDVEFRLDRLDNGSCRVKISATATKTVAELRRPLDDLMKGRPLSNASLNPAVLQLLFSRDGINVKRSIERETRTFILDRHASDIRLFGSPSRVDNAHTRLTQSLLDLYQSKQLDVHLRGRDLPADLMKQVVKKFGPELQGLKEKVPGAEFTLNTRRHIISIQGQKEVKAKVEELVDEVARMSGQSIACPHPVSTSCPICLCEVEESYMLEGCGHSFCRNCLIEQCESAIKSHDSFPVCCTREGCRAPIWITDLKSLLSPDKLENLFRASLRSFVACNSGIYRFCPSPDCPAVYKVANQGAPGEPFLCGACYVETCTKCHVEYHPYISCEMYQDFKIDPDLSLKEWRKGKEDVKQCPVCSYTIEKVDGCNHIECKCGKHICWNCLEYFESSENCYDHLRSIHQTII